MSTSTLDATAAGVRFTRDAIHIALRDGREISAPLKWFPRLAAADADERANWLLVGRGHAIHWPDVDEDISVPGLLGLPD